MQLFFLMVINIVISSLRILSNMFVHIHHLLHLLLDAPLFSTQTAFLKYPSSPIYSWVCGLPGAKVLKLNLPLLAAINYLSITSLAGVGIHAYPSLLLDVADFVDAFTGVLSSYNSCPILSRSYCFF